MNKISKISHRFSLLFKALLIIYPLMVIAMWLGGFDIPIPYLSFTKLPPVGVDLHTLRFILRFWGCVIELFPTMIIMLGFYYLIQLFKLYANNIIFGPENVKLIKYIGYTLIGQVIISFITQPLLSIVLTLDAAPGHHMITLGIGSDEISNMIIGGIVVLISWIMEEGRKLEEETAFTV